jgi:hypothetical protein
MISPQIFFPNPRALHLLNSTQTPTGLFLSEDMPAAMKELCDAAAKCIKAASKFFIADANRIASQSFASLSHSCLFIRHPAAALVPPAFSPPLFSPTVARVSIDDAHHTVRAVFS